jgi:hypothetical protein
MLVACPSYAALTNAVPGLRAATRPVFETVAKVGLVDSHAASAVASRVVPSESVAVRES